MATKEGQPSTRRSLENRRCISNRRSIRKPELPTYVSPFVSSSDREIFEMIIDDLIHNIKTSKLIINPNFQRNIVWDLKKKEELIDSIFRGFAIPSLIFSINENGIQMCVDGRQRIDSILDFTNNGFAIDHPANKHKRLKYAALSEEDKTLFLNQGLIVTAYKNIDPYDIQEIFIRLQGGVDFRNGEKYHAMSETSVIKYIRETIVEQSTVYCGEFAKFKDHMAIYVYLVHLYFFVTDKNFVHHDDIDSTLDHLRNTKTIDDDIFEDIIDFLQVLDSYYIKNKKTKRMTYSIFFAIGYLYIVEKIVLDELIDKLSGRTGDGRNYGQQVKDIFKRARLKDLMPY